MDPLRIANSDEPAGCPLVRVIDDDPLLVETPVMLMEAEQFAAEAYRSAEDFLAAFDPRTLGCTLLDYALSGMDGLELQNELAAQQAKMPIIFLSGAADVPVSVQALQSGAVDFLQKPVRETALLESVRRAIVVDRQARLVAERKVALLTGLGRLTQREWEVMTLGRQGADQQAGRKDARDQRPDCRGPSRTGDGKDVRGLAGRSHRKAPGLRAVRC